MGIVFKPEPLPPGWSGMSIEQKRDWYVRARSDAMRTVQRQGGVINRALTVLISFGALAVLALLFGH